MNEHLCNTSDDYRAEVTIPRDEYERLQAEGVLLREHIKAKKEIMSALAESISQKEQLRECVRNFLKVLHPGAIGLILTKHGRERGNEASAAVLRGRHTLNSPTSSLVKLPTLSEALAKDFEDYQDWPNIQDRK